MGKENKSYRIRTEVNTDNVVNFSMNSTIDTFEILSLKINQKNTYRLMGSNTGIVVGRVLANGGFGVPNVKVSIFIPYEDTENISQRILYHYDSTKDTDDNGVRYNLLPNELDDECHQNIGTFPSKRVLLDNNNWIEVFDKYYKLTTRTNDAGDYMIYGVPTGNQTIHMDIDLSDIGVLSQRPRDLIYKGYNANMFENMTKFKVDTNIDSLAQVITQDQAIYVYPFWGDTTDNNLNASITRCDLNVNYKFEPTCIFMGSVITDTGENSMTKKCIGAKKQGKMNEMITGDGRIEMIRKTPNGQIEQFSVKGDANINSDGVWCYQIPMNLDYVKTDEFGKMVMSDDPNTGLPTRARVRFRLSMSESPNDGNARKRARFLIPNNPHFIEEDYPSFCETKEIDYEFGTKTKNENFRDLFWNNVYTVKSYIPRLQKSRLPNNVRHLGIKMVNHAGSNNPMPFNNLRIKFNFVYMFLCVLAKVLVTIVNFINSILTFIGYIFMKIGYMFFDLSKEINIDLGVFGHPLSGVAKLFAKYNGRAIDDDDGMSANDFLKKVWEDVENGTTKTGGLSVWFLKIFLNIGCGIELKGLCETDDGVEINVTPGTYDKVKDELRKAGIATCNDRVDILYNCIENQLAQDNEVTSFNFYNDWVNGVVYLPLWYRRIKKKRNGTIKKDQWCSTDNTILHTRKHKKNLRLYATNVIKRTIIAGTSKTMGKLSPLVNNEQTAKAIADDESGIEIISFTKYNEDNCYGYNCHKYARNYFKIYKGLVYEKITTLGDKVYYYKPCDYDQSTGNSELVTLFATDLVLLGSLNECDMHGIPQFFKALESTTYNMPPDLLSETYDYVNEDSQTKPDNEDGDEIDLGSRMTEYTGADWGNLGVDQSNYNQQTISFLGVTYTVNANENEYDNGGLFYGLTCFNSYTKPKSCINLSRICELGVSLDESQELDVDDENNSGTDNNSATLTPDGFISYDEIYNPDYRSMFATLNANFLRTKLNPDTGLLEYDFNHMYLDNFDGSLKNLMMAKTVNGKTEQSDFQEKANYINNHNLEMSSDAYLNFRYGNYVKKNNNKIYFYENNNTVGYALDGNGKRVRILGKNKTPRYENSFYFYFGLNEGKTAIDKFNNEFFSDCTNKFAADVPYEMTYRGNSWCPVYSTDGFIAFNMNIEAPYTVTFTDKDNNKVYYQTSINKEKFIFHQLTPEQPIPEGYEKYTLYTLNFKNDFGVIETIDILPSGTYSVLVTDAYDNEYDDNLTFELPRVGFLCDVNPFSARNVEMLVRFKLHDYDNIKTIYTNIANFGKFANGEYNIEYTSYQENDIILGGTTYYEKVNNEYLSRIATSNILVTNSEVNVWFFKHNPRIDRDINGYIGISEVTEFDFRITLEPINTLFFGNNYKGTSFDVHTTFNLIPDGTTIEYNGIYYTKDVDGYTKIVNTDIDMVVRYTYELYHTGDVINIGDTYYTENGGVYIEHIQIGTPRIVEAGDVFYYITEPFYSATIDVEDHEYFLYKTDDTISVGDVYYTKNLDNTYTPHTQTGAAYRVTNDDQFYYHIDICGYLGFYTHNGVTNFLIGVPYGNERYRLTITQLCYTNGNWIESNNVTIINIVVYEDEFKMYLNDIDYDIISQFKTGWVKEYQLKDGKFVRDDPEKNSYYDYTNIYGWDDVLNVGYYDDNGIQRSLTTNINNTTPAITYITTQTINTSTENTIRKEIRVMLNMCRVLSSSYENNGVKDAYDLYVVGDTISNGTTYYTKSGDSYISHTASSSITVQDGDEYYYKVQTTPYCWTKEYTYDAPSYDTDYYFKGSVVKKSYTYEIPYRFRIKENVILYDSFGNFVNEENMVYDEYVLYNVDDVINPGDTYYIKVGSEYEEGTPFTAPHTVVEGEEFYHKELVKYYLDDEHQIEAIGHEYDSSWQLYDYTWMNWLYDSNGNPIYVNDFVKNENYYIDVDHTVDAVLNEHYYEDSSEVVLDNIMRVNHKIDYRQYNLDDYLFTGDVYYLKYNNVYHQDTVQQGFENGISVQDYSNIHCSGNPLYYKLDESEYTADYVNMDTSNYEIIASESADGDITYGYSYTTSGNFEYIDLDCCSLITYKGVVDAITNTVDYRSDLTRRVAAAFRINNKETMLTITSKTKAKPVKYLIVGSKEISKSNLLFEYTPKKITPIISTPLKLINISQVKDTKFVSLVDEKVIDGGYVVDVNLETPNISFSLPTLTHGPWYVLYNANELLFNGTTYYTLVDGEYIPNTARILANVSMGGSKTKIYGSADHAPVYMRYKNDSVVNAGDTYYTREGHSYTAKIASSTTTVGNREWYFKTPDIPYYTKIGRTYSQMFPSASIVDGQTFYTSDYIAYNINETIEVGTIYYIYSIQTNSFVRDNSLTLPHTVTASDTKTYYYNIMTQHTAIVALSVADYKELYEIGEGVEFYKVGGTNDSHFIPYTKDNTYKHPYYVSMINGNESIIPPGKDLGNFEDLGENKNLTTTFGVHFYNKPLTSDINCVFAYINGVPAYPEFDLGGNAVYGIKYTLGYYVYSITRYTDITETLNDGTIVIGRKDNEGNTFYRYTVQGSGNTVETILNDTGCNSLYHDFLNEVQRPPSTNVYLNAGDIIFKMDNTTPYVPNSVTGRSVTLRVVTEKKKLIDYIDAISKYYLPNYSDESYKTVDCIEFIRVNGDETYYYYMRDNFDGNEDMQEYDSDTPPSNTNFKLYQQGKVIPANWDYYKYEPTGSGKYAFKVYASDTQVTVPQNAMWYYYESTNWYVKRRGMAGELIFNNNLYYDSIHTSVILQQSTPVDSPIKVTGSLGTEERIDLTYESTSGKYVYYRYIKYNQGDEIVGPAIIYFYYDGDYTFYLVPSNHTYRVTTDNVYRKDNPITYYGSVTNMAELSTTWKPVDVSMPGFMAGYLINGTPIFGQKWGENIKDPDNEFDKSNIVAKIEDTELALYTCMGGYSYINPDAYDNIWVRRLMFTEYDTSVEHPTYGSYIINSNLSLQYQYQYVEVPLSDTDLVYTDGYGEEYRYAIKGTTSVMFDFPNINQLNEGRKLEDVENRLDDYLKYRTFYTSDDGYTMHQSAYYLFDLSETDYPLYYYYDSAHQTSKLNSNLKYDFDKGAYYFQNMPELFKKIINGTIGEECISESKSIKFNLSNYLRKKYGQEASQEGDLIPEMIRYPRDKFFVIGVCDGNYSISPVLETQMIRIICNYNRFDNRNGSPVYITSPYSREYTTADTIYRRFPIDDTIYKGDTYYMRNDNHYDKYTADNNITVDNNNYWYLAKPICEGLHYVEDYYYLMNYRFTVHVALYELEKAAYQEDMFSQVYSRAEGSAEMCYIRVDDYDAVLGHPETYWATALKINMSSLGTDAQDYSPGKINPWLQIMIEDKSSGMRRTVWQTSGDDPSRGVAVTEFNSFDDMYDDYKDNT